MNGLMIRFLRDESGEDLIEYGLLAAFVATVATAIVIGDPIGIKSALVGAFTKADQGIRERSICVHGHMAGYVVENVRFREIVKAVYIPNGDGCGECAVSQAVEEDKGGHIAAHGLGFESGQWAEKLVHLHELGDAVVGER